MSTPSLAPKLTDDVTVYLVLNDFGLPTGRFLCEGGACHKHLKSILKTISFA
jgi:hypothetical protein